MHFATTICCPDKVAVKDFWVVDQEIFAEAQPVGGLIYPLEEDPKKGQNENEEF